jgi:hypothetical protein
VSGPGAARPERAGTGLPERPGGRLPGPDRPIEAMPGRCPGPTLLPQG